jgi:hypothetical protein
MDAMLEQSPETLWLETVMLQQSGWVLVLSQRRTLVERSMWRQRDDCRLDEVLCTLDRALQVRMPMSSSTHQWRTSAK